MSKEAPMTEPPEDEATAVDAHEPTAEHSGKWRCSKWLAISELVVVALIFIADERHLIPVSKTPFLLAFGWVSLRIRRVSWREIGLSRYRNWTRTLVLGAGAGLLMAALELFVTQPFLVHVLGKQPDLELFRALHGNLEWTLIALAGTWTLGAFGEEMVYRGYLMNRVADLLNRTRTAWIASLFAVHIAFGLAHSYQGITGIIENSLAGVLLGLMYLGSRRNLSVPIIAHGVGNTIDFVLIYLGKYPGMF
jgi:membrane protease YdiL (CAAX protease family)